MFDELSTLDKSTITLKNTAQNNIKAHIMVAEEDNPSNNTPIKSYENDSISIENVDYY